MTEIDTSTEAIERLAEYLLFRGHHHQEKITHLIRRLHVERITASKTIRALAAERDQLRTMVDECAIYLKEGETPRQRMDRDHADVLGLMDLLAKEKLNSQAARAEMGALIERAAAVAADHTPTKHGGALAAYVTGTTIERGIRALTPADATAALDQIRRQERAAGKAEGMREAAEKATSFLVGDPANGFPLRNPMAHEVAAAILARAEAIEKGREG